MDWGKAYYVLDCSMCQIQKHETMVCLENSSLRLKYRGQEVTRPKTEEEGRPFCQAQEFGLYLTGSGELI